MQAFQRQMRFSSEELEGVALLWEVLEAALGAGVVDLESLADVDGVVDCCGCWVADCCWSVTGADMVTVRSICLAEGPLNDTGLSASVEGLMA